MSEGGSAYKHNPKLSERTQKFTPKVQDILTKQQILHHLIGLENTDLLWVLHKLADDRPELKLHFINPGEDIPLVAEYSDMSGYSARPEAGAQTKGEYRLLEIPLLDKSEPLDPYCRGEVLHDAATLVQFSAGEFFCKEDEPFVEIEVNRSGDKSKESSVNYYTQDNSAKGNVRYIPKQGTLTFPTGAGSAKFQVELKSSQVWEGLAEFRVHLKSEGISNCSLAHQLQYARVKIIGCVTFPSNQHNDLLRGGNKESILTINWVSLLFQYLYMNFANEDVRRGTIKRCLIDQFHNLTFIVHLFCQVFLLDYVINIHKPLLSFGVLDTRTKELLVIATFDLMIVILVHVTEYAKYCWSVGGPSRKVLMRGIMMTYLNYDYATSIKMGDGGMLTMGLTRDSVDLVKEGYSHSMKLLQAFGEVFVLILFPVLSPIVFNRPFRPVMFLPVVIYPLVQIPFICGRVKRTTTALRDRQDAQDEIVNYGHEAVLQRSLILDYKLRQDYVNRLDLYIQQYNAANKVVSKVMLNNKEFMLWLTALVMGWWTIYGGMQVIQQNMTVGFFVTTFKVYSKVGKAYARAYSVSLDLQKVVPALVRICTILNSPTDLEIRLKNERENRKETNRRRNALSGKFPSAALNHVTLVLKDIVFKFGQGISTHRTIGGQITYNGTLEIEQGTMVCLIGREGEGKSTLMRLIGGAIVPTLLKGHLFIPSHLRVLHVMSEPLFFRGTMLYNLTVGCMTTSDAAAERVQKILDRLSLPKEISLHSETKWDWKNVLTMTQCHKLNITRALVANAHLMCVHKPTMAYDEEASKVVVGLLKEFVAERGIYQTGDFDTRRPRTCIFTSSKIASAGSADVLYRVTNNRVERLQRGERIMKDDFS